MLQQLLNLKRKSGSKILRTVFLLSYYPVFDGSLLTEVEQYLNTELKST